ncbi:FAD-binding domain-containing protein [Multifurca ochricompacta]|uniref:FAD-binding domain-containing protein n=1 Tax=Multifurca ochricompacta TaxID=376703 RepID=A0AAD4LTT9_9AGAM|nr:FAD-binding domain-containing protein [Multifurca ochricompacta]
MRDSSPGNFQAVCNQIASAVSNASQVFPPSAPQYTFDNQHEFFSATQASACSVEPGSVEDVSVITRTPFAVKGGGHTGNPGFSSTPGVQIAMTRFNAVNVNADAGTVDVGSGLTWDNVYQQLSAFNLTVAGGRIPGVGVGGLLLGGGYSFIANQYGLGIDNVVAYDLVLPNGTFKKVTADDHDLWFGLRGIVTQFTLKSFPQGEVWGGIVTWGTDQLEASKNAIAKFANVTDPKAAILSTFAYISGDVLTTTSVFYDGPVPPPGIFDDFINIPAIQKNLSTRSFPDLVKSQVSTTIPSDVRGLYCAFGPTEYSTSYINDSVNEVIFWGRNLTQLDPKVQILAGIEPFTSGLLSHGTPSAYPPDRSQIYFPSGIALTWSNSSLDQIMAQSIRQAADDLQAAALREGQNVTNAVVYPNYSLFDTPLEAMYGDNVERLRKLKQVIDPGNVMNLSGGFRF